MSDISAISTMDKILLGIVLIVIILVLIGTPILLLYDNSLQEKFCKEQGFEYNYDLYCADKFRISDKKISCSWISRECDWITPRKIVEVGE